MNDNEKKVDEQTVEQPEATSAETSDKAVENTQSEVAAADAGQHFQQVPLSQFSSRPGA